MVAPKKRAPSTNGRNGKGQFTVGNAGGPGNPLAKQTAALRAALIEAITPQDIKDIAAALLVSAKAGDVTAMKEVFDRCFGKSSQSISSETNVNMTAAIQVVHVDDWYGSKAANLAATNAASIGGPDVG